jgi:hypothetical protein
MAVCRTAEADALPNQAPGLRVREGHEFYSCRYRLVRVRLRPLRFAVNLYGPGEPGFGVSGEVHMSPPLIRRGAQNGTDVDFSNGKGTSSTRADIG